MRWVPKDRWNAVLLFAAVGVAVWIALIVLGQIIGENSEVGDDALLIGAAAGFFTLLANQVHHGRQIEHVAEQVTTVEETTNGESVTLESIGQQLAVLTAAVEALGHPPAVPPAGTSVTPQKRPQKRRR